MGGHDGQVWGGKRILKPNDSGIGKLRDINIFEQYQGHIIKYPIDVVIPDCGSQQNYQVEGLWD